MKRAKDIPEAIHWHEGMLLTPQHFQQFAVRQEEIVAYTSHAAEPYFWGVHRLKLDVKPKGLLQVEELEAVMPDGLIVELDMDQNPLEIPLGEFKEGFKDGCGTVQLVVPSRTDGKQVDGRQAGNGPGKSDGRKTGEEMRYRSISGEAVRDETTGEGAECIPRLSPKLSLLVAEEAPAGHQALPIARVRKSSGEFHREDFAPPSPFVRPGDLLEKPCHEVADAIRRTAGDAATLSRLLAFALNAGLVQLDAVLRSKRCHPRELYIALCHVAGHVTVLTEKMAAPYPPRYNHRDLLAVFAPVLKYIREALEQGFPKSHTPFYFRREGDGFRIRLLPEWLVSPPLIEARSASGATPNVLASWLSAAVIATSSSVEALRRKRMLGVARNRVESSGYLIPKSGAVLVQLESQKTYLQANEELQVFNVDGPKDAEPVQMILWVKKPGFGPHTEGETG